MERLLFWTGRIGFSFGLPSSGQRVVFRRLGWGKAGAWRNPLGAVPIIGGILLGLLNAPLLGQQSNGPLQWLPHPAVVAQSVRATAGEIPSDPSIKGQRPAQLSPPTQPEHPSALSPKEYPSDEGAVESLPAEKAFSRLVADPLGGAAGAGALPQQDLEKKASPAPLPDSIEPPYLPEEATRPIPPVVPEKLPRSTRPLQVRAECIHDANLLVPIHNLTTRIDIDPNVHPEITPEEEARLQQAGQPTRLEQLRRAKAEFDSKMWCEPPPTALPERMRQPWPQTTITWKASGLCHKPLYFEQPHLERYGHSTGPLTQPIVSAAHFYLMIPTLPYQLALWPPYECIYPLGYYRPGSCAPYYLDPIPISIRAGLAEAGAWVGGVFLVP